MNSEYQTPHPDPHIELSGVNILFSKLRFAGLNYHLPKLSFSLTLTMRGGGGGGGGLLLFDFFIFINIDVFYNSL